MRCDFCGAPFMGPYYEWECPSIEVDYLFQQGEDLKQDTSHYSGNWKACVTCHDLILLAQEEHDPDRINEPLQRLADRGTDVMISACGITDEEAKRLARALVFETHASFLKFHTGRYVFHDSL